MTVAAGLCEHEVEMILGVLHRHPEISAAVLYGSRAKGTHLPASDVDLAIQGEVSDLQAESIAAEMDELPLPYRFGIRAFDSIRSAVSRDSIIHHGVVLYGNWKL